MKEIWLTLMLLISFASGMQNKDVKLQPSSNIIVVQKFLEGFNDPSKIDLSLSLLSEDIDNDSPNCNNTLSVFLDA